MPKYTTVKPIIVDGQSVKAGESITLSERQAKYLLLAGKVRLVGEKSTQAPKAAKKKEN